MLSKVYTTIFVLMISLYLSYPGRGQTEVSIFGEGDEIGDSINLDSISRVRAEERRLKNEIKDSIREEEVTAISDSSNSSNNKVGWMPWFAGGLLLGVTVGASGTYLFLRNKLSAPDRKQPTKLEVDSQDPVTDDNVVDNDKNNGHGEVGGIPEHKNTYTVLFEQWEKAGARFVESLTSIDKRTRLASILPKLVGEPGTEHQGLLGLVEDWKKANAGEPHSTDVMLKVLNRREVVEYLSWLARLNLVTGIREGRDYFNSQGVNVKALQEYTASVFNLLEKHLGLKFIRPDSGEQYNEQKYDLVISNIGVLSGLDGGALLRELNNWNPEAKQPIYDVGELSPVIETISKDLKILSNFPSKTSVAYYSKN